MYSDFFFFFWLWVVSLEGFPDNSSWSRICLQFKRHRRRGFNPWVGKIPWRRKWRPTGVGLAWEIPWAESGRLQSKGPQRVRPNRARTHAYFSWYLTAASVACDAILRTWGFSFIWVTHGRCNAHASGGGGISQVCSLPAHPVSKPLFRDQWAWRVRCWVKVPQLLMSWPFSSADPAQLPPTWAWDHLSQGPREQSWLGQSLFSPVTSLDLKKRAFSQLHFQCRESCLNICQMKPRGWGHFLDALGFTYALS